MSGAGASGERMRALIERLYPLCRSITGDGLRETLRVLAEDLPLTQHEVASGTRVLDWTVPEEWNIRDAWIKDRSGRRVVDFRACNLHVVNYSVPVPAQRISRQALDAHLHSLPGRPDWIPYRTSYYDESWGFCLSHAQRVALTDDEYDVCIDSSREPGALSYAELLIEGESAEEVLISSHVCHPSLANDNLSGIAVAAELARALLARSSRKLSYRFLFAPGTIGALTWLAQNPVARERIAHGLTLVCLGDDRPLGYKQTFSGRAEIDRAAACVLAARDEASRVRPFHPYGYDERQYNSPGFRIPVGSLMRGQHGEFPEYHTSADDLEFVSVPRLEDARDCILEIFDVLERNARYQNRAPHGEPQLGRRGLYRALGGEADSGSLSMAMLWILQFSDGEHDLLSVAERSGLAWASIARAAELLEEKGLLERWPASEALVRAGEATDRGDRNGRDRGMSEAPTGKGTDPCAS